jgi:hypothetical protein
MNDVRFELIEWKKHLSANTQTSERKLFDLNFQMGEVMLRRAGKAPQSMQRVLLSGNEVALQPSEPARV